MAGLQAILAIVRTVAKHDDAARIALCEHAVWKPLDIIRGLFHCSIDLSLKIDLFSTLAALNKSQETVLQIWKTNEASQSNTIIPSTNAISTVSRDINHVNITSDSVSMEQTKFQKPLLKNETKVNEADNMVSCC